MSLRSAFTVALLSLVARNAAALEIWLAHTPECNSCAVYARVAERRDYDDALHYRDGDSERVIPIRDVAKSALSPDILRQLPDILRDPRYWSLNLIVLVVDDGRVLAAGNIAESADNRLIAQPDEVMFPPAEPEEGDPALTEHDLYANFFVAHWNLEYFVDVALGKRQARQPAPLVDLESPHPWSSGPANVVLWGSAGTPLKNALFIPQRIAEIHAELDALGLPDVRYVTLYGHGPDVPGNDTSYIGDGKIRFERADLPADFSASGESLNRVLTGIRRDPASRSLLIQVGHSGPVGSALWGTGLTFMPDDLAALKQESAAKLIMISGACNSGKFAEAVQCGFFAAHPDVVASGCQLSPEALETSDDYLRFFFRDATKRPAPTLYAAHWYASTRLEDHQISYTTTDALIDDYFAAHPDDLPRAMTVDAIRQASGVLGPAEKQALESLTAGLAGDLSIPLTGYVALNHSAQEKLSDATELSSRDRNRITAMPYKLMLPVLARRLVYNSLHVHSPEFVGASTCETQSIPGFLEPGADR